MSAYTQTAISNLITMGITSTVDHRQHIPDAYGIPDAETRLLRAKLILEEALETIAALGCSASVYHHGYNDEAVEVYEGEEKEKPNLEGIIDGCCDLIYVATGTLCSVGAPDGLHLREVCEANERKFPKGQVLKNESGKFLKPVDWVGPDHMKIAVKQFKMHEFSQMLIADKIRHDEQLVK